MKSNEILAIVLFSLVFLFHTQLSVGQKNNYPNPLTNPDSPVMLSGDWVPENTHEIVFSNLPRIPSEHSVICDVRYAWGRKVNQHNYLVYYSGRF